MDTLQIKLNRLNAQLKITKGRRNQRKLIEKILKVESAINKKEIKVMTIKIAHIPFDSEDENLLSDSKVIAVQEGGCFWYNDGFEPRLIPLPTAQWAEIPVTPEMAQTYGDYAGLYLPSGEITTDGSLWADAWGIQVNSLTYSVGFVNEINQIIINYLDALEASLEASKKAKEAWLAGQAEREKAAEIAAKQEKEAKEKEWSNYLSIKDRLKKYDRYENSDYCTVTHGTVISERTETSYLGGSDISSSDGMGSRSTGGWFDFRIVTYRLPSGEIKELTDPPKPKSEKEWVLSHNAGYWTREKERIENPPKVEAAPEPEPAPISESQKLINDFGAKFPQLIEECQKIGIQVRLTSGEERRIVVRSRDLRNGYESFPITASELHQAVIEAIAFKSRKNELEAKEKEREEQITAQQKECQLPYKVACEKAGYRVEWNQGSYLAKVGKNWTDCRTVCRQKNLTVEFSKKPKLVLKK